MEKLTYKNEEQLINDAVRMFIKNHLAFGVSHVGMPSKDLGGVRGIFFYTRVTADFTAGEWVAVTYEERYEYAKKVNRQFDKALDEADRKWEAVKTLLDL